jgi:DNA-directed RNA polymerase specialized sigma24 family protein
MKGAMRSAFDGRFLGEFHSWMNSIARHKIADYYRRKERTAELVPLGEEHEGEDDAPYPVQGRIDNGYDEFAFHELTDQVLRQRSDLHATIVKLYGASPPFLGLKPAETREEIERLFPGETASDSNIYKVWQRFKEDFAEALDKTS